MKKLSLMLILAAGLAACVGKGPQSPPPNHAGPTCGISTTPSAPNCE